MKTSSKVANWVLWGIGWWSTVALSFAQPIFRPWIASPWEPRIGAATFIGSDSLELYLGGYVRLFGNQGQRWQVGAEGFTISRLRREAHFKFPVELIDYYFGVDYQRAGTTLNIPWQLRVRLGHISAHVVDGAFDRLPSFVYSQEFVTATLRLIFAQLHVLSEIAYLFSVLPAQLDRLQPAVGATLHLTVSGYHLLAGYRLRNVGIGGNRFWNHRIVLQVWPPALPLYFQFSFYNGKSYHGMLYDRTERFATLGVFMVP